MYHNQTCIKRSPLVQRKSGLKYRWRLKRSSVHMKSSLTGQENVTFKYRWLLNRSDHMSRYAWFSTFWPWKTKVTFKYRWLLNRGDHMSRYAWFSTFWSWKTKVTFKYRWSLNRGDHMGRFDCILLFNFLVMKHRGNLVWNNWDRFLILQVHQKELKRKLLELEAKKKSKVCVLIWSRFSIFL
jgi:hypothetical protein